MFRVPVFNNEFKVTPFALLIVREVALTGSSVPVVWAAVVPE